MCLCTVFAVRPVAVSDCYTTDISQSKTDISQFMLADRVSVTMFLCHGMFL